MRLLTAVVMRSNQIFCDTAGTLYGDQYTFFIISGSTPLRMVNVSDEHCRENPNIQANAEMVPKFPSLYYVLLM
jgi:hypothetical protein